METKKFRLEAISMQENIKIETGRLIIMALSRREFRMLLDDRVVFDRNMGLSPRSGLLDRATMDAMEWLYAEMAKNPTEDYYWHTSWQIILKEENLPVGSLCLKGAPDSNRQVEVGYGTDPAHRNKGYMKEALAGLCRWALNLETVKTIIAETEHSNIASQRVLRACGMRQYGSSEEGNLLWRLDKNL